jgi:hypothetical protein|tara:strand:+ start:1347 stop:1625 length:279 start_codon:yes stop_codon:yes gene_type:complete
MAKVNENSEVTIPLKNLISLVAGAGFAVWVYFGIEERIAMIEYTSKMHEVSIQNNYNWTKDWVPPPAVAIAVKRVRDLELKVKELEVRLEQK